MYKNLKQNIVTGKYAKKNEMEDKREDNKEKR